MCKLFEDAFILIGLQASTMVVMFAPNDRFNVDASLCINVHVDRQKLSKDPNVKTINSTFIKCVKNEMYH